MRVTNAKNAIERITDMGEKLGELEVAMEKLEKRMQMVPHKFGKRFRECICQEVHKEITERLFEIIKDSNDRDIRIFHMMSQMDSMEKSIKDTNRKIIAIRNQLRKERGREEVK